jgi:hypothetical protein
MSASYQRVPTNEPESNPNEPRRARTLTKPFILLLLAVTLLLVTAPTYKALHRSGAHRDQDLTKQAPYLQNSTVPENTDMSSGKYSVG